MKALSRFLMRFWYPVTLPEDVATALGIQMSNFVSFDDFFKCLIHPGTCPTRLMKFMPREKAEAAFASAQRTERFTQNTLCSYYFNEGWVEFVLKFDEKERLRRIYLLHKQIQEDQGVEIHLRHV